VIAAVWGDLPVPDHAADEAGRRARDVLSRPEFRPPAKSVTERIFEWIFGRLGDLIDALSGGGTASLVAWAITIASVALFVLVMVALVRSLRANPVSPPVATASDVGRPARAWMAEAEAHEARGEWRAALRCRYRALIADLARRGLLDEIPGRTAGEYRGEVHLNLPHAAPDFDGATALFELAWYGDRPTGEPERDRFRGHADRVAAGANA
jgi:hypothetical protein